MPTFGLFVTQTWNCQAPRLFIVDRGGRHVVSHRGRNAGRRDRVLRGGGHDAAEARARAFR